MHFIRKLPANDRTKGLRKVLLRIPLYAPERGLRPPSVRLSGTGRWLLAEEHIVRHIIHMRNLLGWLETRLARNLLAWLETRLVSLGSGFGKWLARAGGGRNIYLSLSLSLSLSIYIYIYIYICRLCYIILYYIILYIYIYTYILKRGGSLEERGLRRGERQALRAWQSPASCTPGLR